MQRFNEAIVQPAPGTGHVAFGMQAQADTFTAPQPFIDAGFTGFGVATLTVPRSGLLPLPKAPDGTFDLRPLRLPAEVSGVVELNMACNDEGYEPEGYRQFRSHQMQRYGDMAAAGTWAASGMSKPTLTFAARACAVHWCMRLAHRASRTWAGTRW